MRAHIPKLLILLAVALAGSQSAEAQKHGHSTFYDVTTETTYQGRVASVDHHDPWQCAACSEDGLSMSARGGPGVHLLVSTAAGEVEVHVGPRDFLETYSLTVERGDLVEVVGSRVPLGGTTVVLAKEISVNGRCLLLRSNDGTPRWSDNVRNR